MVARERDGDWVRAEGSNGKVAGYPNFPTTTIGRTKLPAIARGKGMKENRFKGGKHLVRNALPIFGSSGRANIEYLERLAKLGRVSCGGRKDNASSACFLATLVRHCFNEGYPFTCAVPTS
jgi:hypothetical protein